MEETNKPVKEKWYQTTKSIVIAILIVGPLALPLVWLKKSWTPMMKLAITVILIFLTLALMRITSSTLDQLNTQLDQFQSLR
jgi:uncharacterized membrane protein